LSVPLLQISVDVGVYNERLSIILGFLTLFLTLATLFSCRNFTSFLKLIGVKNPAGNKLYAAFFKYHSLYWYGLVFVLVLHPLVGIMHIVFTDSTDPDAYLHTWVLAAGAAAFALILIILVSCRSLVAFLGFITGKNPLAGKSFAAFYRLHAYFWFLLIIIIVLHFSFSYLHTGIWVN
jgi:hypothetical protein